MAWVAATYWQRRGQASQAEKILQDLCEAVDADQKAGATVLLARLYVIQQQVEKAEQAYNVAIKLTSDQPGGYVELAGFYRKAGRIDDAVKCYRQVLGLQKKGKDVDSTIRQQLVETLLQSRKLDDASKEIEAFHQAYPEESVYQLLRGTLLMLQGRSEEAISTLTEYLKNEPNSAPARFHRGLLYMATNRLSQAIQDLTMAKQLQPNGFGYEHRTSLAQAYEGNGQPQEAITELNQILTSHPDAVLVARLLGSMYQRAGRTDDLEVLIRKYMDMAPKDPGWPQTLGRLGESLGKYDVAVSGYTQAAKVSNFAQEPVDNLLRTQIEAKHYNEAIDYVEKTMPEACAGAGGQGATGGGVLPAGRQREGAGPAERSGRGIGQGPGSQPGDDAGGHGRSGAERAAEILKERIAADPDNLIVRYMLVAMLGERKQWDEAEKYSAELLTKATSDSDKAMVLRQRGALLYQANKREQAAKAFEEMLKVAPDDPDGINNVAYILAEDLNRPKEALPYAKRAADLRRATRT